MGGGASKLSEDYVASKQWYPAGQTGNRDLDILFFHGMQDRDGSNAREKTWTNSNGENWAKQWLYEKLNLGGRSVRILGIEYNAHASTCNTGRFGVSAPGHLRIAQNLFQNLVSSTRVDLGGKPFVLVGHSYGGIVIKSLVAYCSKVRYDGTNPRAMEAARRFMANFKGYVFYGVPQKGSPLASYARAGGCNPLRLGPSVTKDLQPRAEDTYQLARDFALAVPEGALQFAFGETVPTAKCGSSLMVVPLKSAQGDLRHTQFMALQGKDHFTIVKPYSKNDEGFTKFVELIQDVVSSLPLPRIETHKATNVNPHTRDAVCRFRDVTSTYTRRLRLPLKLGVLETRIARSL